jgi:hypothetical protein
MLNMLEIKAGLHLQKLLQPGSHDVHIQQFILQSLAFRLPLEHLQDGTEMINSPGAEMAELSPISRLAKSRLPFTRTLHSETMIRLMRDNAAIIHSSLPPACLSTSQKLELILLALQRIRPAQTFTP